MAIDISNGLKEGDIEIKIITCNTTSITLLTDEKFGGKVIQPDVKANRALAEHGLAMSISIKLNDTKHHFLLDTGGLNGTFIKNSENLKVNLEVTLLQIRIFIAIRCQLHVVFISPR